MSLTVDTLPCSHYHRNMSMVLNSYDFYLDNIENSILNMDILFKERVSDNSPPRNMSAGNSNTFLIPKSESAPAVI